jgi:hypothetical protein
MITIGFGLHPSAPFPLMATYTLQRVALTLTRAAIGPAHDRPVREGRVPSRSSTVPTILQTAVLPQRIRESRLRCIALPWGSPQLHSGARQTCVPRTRGTISPWTPVFSAPTGCILASTTIGSCEMGGVRWSAGMVRGHRFDQPPIPIARGGRLVGFRQLQVQPDEDTLPMT